jgi:hypothetical protein
MSAITAVYPPPIPGLPFLAVVIIDGDLDVTPFKTFEEADAYIAVCDAGMLADSKKSKPTLDA